MSGASRVCGGLRHQGQGSAPVRDLLPEEGPLEIAVFGEPLATTMRTPLGWEGDRDLAAGFLLAEGVIDEATDLAGIAPCRDPAVPAGSRVLVALASGVPLPSAERLFLSGSSCGLCGKALAERLAQRIPQRPPPAPLRAADIRAADGVLKGQQPLFEATGGVHAAAVFAGGEPLGSSEDVGRHNAVDRVVGGLLLAGRHPLHGTWLWVSGRVSFEIVQKALRAEVDGLVAVGAPTALAVDLAERHGLTLCGFARSGRFTVYAGQVRA